MDFRILGPLEVVGPEGVLRIGGGKRRALLALLLLRANEVVSADALIEALWGGGAPSAPRTALHVLVSDLRKELGQEGAARLETHGGGYALRVDADELDSARFARAIADARVAMEAGRAEDAESRLRRGIDLWRGPPLQEFTYDDFAQADIARLESLRGDADEDLVDAELALGRHSDAVAALERLVSEQPARERRRAQLMLALYRAGRQSDALEAYQDARAYFVAELGIEPGPQLRHLQRQILDHDPALDTQAVPIRVAPRRHRLAIAVVAVATAGVVAAAAAVLATRSVSHDRPVAVVPHSLALVDPALNRLVADVRLLPAPRATPFQATDLAVGFGSIWVTDAGEQTLLRVDARSHAVAGEVGIGGDVRALAVGFGSVVADGNSAAVSRIDPRTNRVVATIALGAQGPSYSIAVGAGFVWAAAGQRFVAQIDPRSDRVLARVPVADVTALAGTAGSVYCGTQSGTIERIDLGGGRARVSRFAKVDRPVQRLQVVGRALWAVVQAPQFEVWRLDLRDGHVVSTIEVGQVALGLAATQRAVFVPLYREGELVTLAPVRNAISHRLVLRPRLSGVVSGAGLVWVLVA